MSIHALSWAFDQEVYSSPQKFVLIALANFASETGKSYPSVGTVAKMTGQMDGTVRKAFKALTEQGLITDTGKRAGATQQVKVFQFPAGAYQRLAETGGFESNDKTSAKTPSKTPPKTTTKVCAKTPKNGEQPLEPGTVTLNQEPKTSGDEKEPSPYKAFSDGWCDAFKERFGAMYPYGGRDAKAVAELLKAGENPDGLVALAEQAWSKMDRTKYWKCVNMTAHVWDFARELPAIRKELDQDAQKLDAEGNIKW